MATIIGVRLGRILNNNLLNKPILSVGVQKCFISNKIIRDENKHKPKPFPYKEKRYTFLRSLLDDTLSRFDENTKLIVVDGPVASGKTILAKKIAEEFEMEYFPPVDMDLHYINPYGYDMRQLDPQLPKSVRSYDNKNFCLDPNDKRAATYQINMYILRLAQYIDALAHILNTGQGCVLQRSVYSDMVFAEAMVKCGYMSKEACSIYYEIRKTTIPELMRPHLAIYLDVPPANIINNIKKRNIDYEVNSKLFSKEYLEAMEDAYKHKYLKEISTHSELLIYDWSEIAEADIVVEDIERIDFDKYGRYDKKLCDWRLENREEWKEPRELYTNQKSKLLIMTQIPAWDVPELVMDPDDAKKRTEVWESAPGMKYIPGYNSDQGDSVLFKKKVHHRMVSFR